ncbi:hypothetical protein [Pseudomonas syringae]|uniref:hypothetical protein n=1 Tax=Pseudomonas syringae TaxID=317 RepID=UPI000A1EEA70|nr:hypothetical protein [Pseudomonas syringae]OSN39513.1 hypothetical protein BV342_01224 [Pseudomonas syringae pv. actinidiae]OSR73969.1 hypothetical protein BV326_01425 [Pseudomonas syringae pv. actinidiae]OSR79967.1 hypothetical protein BV328_01664 [Pseudomonas syringae pv. actinidiae]
MSFCIALTSADLALTKDAFAIVGSIASAAGVGLAFYVGLKGLATWKRQLRGAAHHDLARKALVELYKYRESVERARSPVMFANELQPSEDEEAELSFVGKNYIRKCRAYERRFETMSGGRASIQAIIIESEALWGKDLRDLVKPLFSMEYEFVHYVGYFLMSSDPREDDDNRRVSYEVIKDKPKIIYDALGEEGDEFRKDFNRQISVIENYLRPKLA